MKITRMLVCGAETPVALTEEDIVFSLTASCEDSKSAIFSVAVANSRTDIENGKYLYLSEQTDYFEKNYVSVSSDAFPSDRDYAWAILQEGRILSFSRFGTGLREDDFSARWVAREAVGDAAPLFLKKFRIKNKSINRARLYVSGLGYFVCRINGKRVGTDGYVPQVSDYAERPLDGLFETPPVGTRKSVYYLCYDVKELLSAGDNSLACLVGNGWYKNREKPNEGNFYYGEPRLIFQINLTYADGEEQKIISDGETVFSTDSHVLKNTLYTGETVDFLRKDFYSPDDYPPEALKPVKELRDMKGEFLWQKEPSDQAGKEFLPKSIKKTAKGTLIDFGQNHSGVPRLVIKGVRGSRVRLTYGENKTVDDDVDVYSSSWGGHVQTDELILSGGEDEFFPEFTVHGYRYLRISSDCEYEIVSVRSLFIYSAVAEDGSFSCSDRTINGIYRNYRFTHLSNLHGNVPTDCPHRERRGFLGDGHVAMRSAMYAFDMRLSYKKWIKDVRDAQSITGFMPHTAPFAAGGGGPGFGSGCIIIPYQYYKFYGDVSVLEKGYDGMLNWIKYLDTRHDGDGIIVREEKGWCIGDWFNPVLIDLDIPFANTYFFLLSLKRVIEITEILGRTRELPWLTALQAREEKAFLGKYYDPETHLFCKGGKGAAFFGLDLGLLDGEESRRCLNQAIEHIEKDLDYHLETGIFSTPLMFRILSDYNRRDVLEKIITGRTYPGYGYMLERGATTLWEGFEERDGPSYLLRDGCPQTGYGVSHNHPMLGSVCEWFYTDVAGLNLNEFGVTRIADVNPYVSGRITCAEAEKQTGFGKISVRWEKKGDLVSMRLSVPYACKARLKFTDAENVEINGKPFDGELLPCGDHTISATIKPSLSIKR